MTSEYLKCDNEYKVLAVSNKKVKLNNLEKKNEYKPKTSILIPLYK